MMSRRNSLLASLSNDSGGGGGGGELTFSVTGSWGIKTDYTIPYKMTWREFIESEYNPEYYVPEPEFDPAASWGWFKEFSQNDYGIASYRYTLNEGDGYGEIGYYNQELKPCYLDDYIQPITYELI